MSAIHIARVALSVRACVPPGPLGARLPASPSRLGEEIARCAHDYVIRTRLGHYPALEFLAQQAALDAYLLDAVSEVARASTDYVQEHVREKLMAVFSSVQFKSLHVTAYTLPAIRMSQPHALAQLAKHYTPDTVKFELAVALIQKEKAETGLDAFARRALLRWLEDSFVELQVTSARMVSGEPPV